MKRLTKFEVIWAVTVLIILTTLSQLAHAQTLREYNQEYYTRLNSIRQEHNLPLVTVNRSLERKSERWLRRMVRLYNGNLVHQPGKGYEVLSRGGDPILLWMNSPPHKKVLLNPKLKKVGFFASNGYACMKGR